MTPARVSASGAAWEGFFVEHSANVAVTLTYNPHRAGTAGVCYRFAPDTGECLPVRGSGVTTVQGIHRLPSVRHIPLEGVHADLDQLHRTVDRKLFGTRFNRLPAHARSSFLGYIERAHWNLHVHLAWRVPDQRVDEFTEIVTNVWASTKPSASIRVKLAYDPAGWATYIAKEARGAALNSDTALFVASRSARP